jgi:ABC-type molybdate transport system substrate-binding protein
MSDTAELSRALDVRRVLAKVVLGEADAGVVYRSDARGRVQIVDVPGSRSSRARSASG